MVGGIVIEVCDVPNRPTYLYVDTRDGKDTCAICVKKNENSEKIQIGDSLWWQGDDAMWTPASARAKACEAHGKFYCCRKSGIDFDIKIPRIGYSGVEHPSRKIHS